MVRCEAEHGPESGEGQPSNPILQGSKAPTDGNYRLRGQRRPRHRVCFSPPTLCHTFVLLQLPDVAQDRLQIHVEAVAVTQELEEVSGAHGAPCVVDELPGGGQAIWQNLKFLTLWSKSTSQLLEGKSLICQGPLHFLFSKEKCRFKNRCIKLHSKFSER